MSRATRLATHIERTVTGPMWHGPALAEVLKDVTHDQARARPMPNAHSIWELVLHITAWSDIARQRLQGQATGDPAAEQDWPPVSGSVAGSSDPRSGSDPGATWRLAVERLGESHRRLAAHARLLDDATLDALVPGLEYSASVLLHGTSSMGRITAARSRC